MILITCVDDNNGMMFHHRRQSQDKLLREHIINMIGKNHLWINLYSEKQFAAFKLDNIIVDELFLTKAAENDYCFVENIDIITPYVDKIEKIILFKWNRNYPADTFFPINLREWTLERSEEFAGYSHDKITKEIYRR